MSLCVIDLSAFSLLQMSATEPERYAHWDGRCSDRELVNARRPIRCECERRALHCTALRSSAEFVSDFVDIFVLSSPRFRSGSLLLFLSAEPEPRQCQAAASRAALQPVCLADRLPATISLIESAPLPRRPAEPRSQGTQIDKSAALPSCHTDSPIRHDRIIIQLLKTCAHWKRRLFRIARSLAAAQL